MRGPQPTHPIELTTEEVKSLQQLIRAHSTPQTVAVRARIILKAYEHPEQNNQQIASAIGTTDRTVRKWRGRWVQTRTLTDAPRSGAPRRFSPSSARAGHRHRL
jgi:putative transposase